VRDLESRAIRDPLTQLYNKDFFAQRLNQEMRRAVRHSEPLTVAMIDMDLLKTINDTYGHPVGDAVISAVAAVIRDTSRQSDVPCRYGGDEFAVILPETTKLQGCAFGERLMRAVQNLTIVVAVGSQEHGADLSAPGNPNGEAQGESAMPLLAPVPSLSIGLASFPEDARNPEMLLAKADAALYRAKREGRNRIAC
jgi:diguanylate cyclase (GGDEF)-like protein